ncbi:MAG: C40 family peptidase [Coprococcus comes]
MVTDDNGQFSTSAEWASHKHNTKAGDLVFFHSTYNAGSYVTHVGIYVGNNQMYHAGDPIGYADLSSSYWQQHLIGAGRVK